MLSFIQFPQVSERYLISCGNVTGDKNYQYLISSENFLLRKFYPNEADKRSLLFSLPFPKVLELYFYYKKSYMDEKKNWLLGHVAQLRNGLKKKIRRNIYKKLGGDRRKFRKKLLIKLYLVLWPRSGTGK